MDPKETTQETPKTLMPEVADKYDLVKVGIGRHHFAGFGTIDLTTLTVAKADNLVSRGFYWLRARQAAIPPVKANNKAAAGDNANG